MINYVARVRGAHRALGHTVGLSPAFREPELRRALIAEEAAEVVAALNGGDLANLGGELADLVYVLAGSAVSFGLSGIVADRPLRRLGPPRIRLAALAARAIRTTSKQALAAIAAEQLEVTAIALARAIAAAEAVAALCGLELEPFFAAVHAANLAKATGVRRADGKWGKPPGWMPAALKEILAEQQRRRGKRG